MSITVINCHAVRTVEDYERTIADLRGYLHESIKAYDAQELRVSAYCRAIIGQSDYIGEQARDLESQKHTIQELRMQLVALEDARNRANDA